MASFEALSVLNEAAESQNVGAGSSDVFRLSFNASHG